MFLVSFISGPGITGPYSSPAGFPNGSGICFIVPNSSPVPITISSIHPGYNGNFYNTGNTSISYNGYTDVFTANCSTTLSNLSHKIG